jgi:hypothetical protein
MLTHSLFFDTGLVLSVLPYTYCVQGELDAPRDGL